ncbi:neutral cholesterol ester hydrolase 1-like [Diadema antillarum]|uniref:neutral cholesterol ester hydrolase 1-like n=1 Tax=Diadema antillarum TaxID=105358 RepID=UPI003A85E637
MSISLMLSCAAATALVVLVRRIRVPDGMTEPWKYRLMISLFVLPRILEYIYVLLNRRKPFAPVQAKRLIYESTEARPKETRKGSNIRSRVTDFDGVRVRLYEPIRKKNGLQPGILFFHGGGMVYGSADFYNHLTRKIAEELDTFVASVDYRLAPEHPFPVGFNDNLRAVKWFLNNATDFDVDAHRVCAVGDSAGGCFAAGLSQVVYDDVTIPNFKLQVLIYPALQQLDFKTHSYQKYEAEFGDGGFLSKLDVCKYVSMYLHGLVDPVTTSRSMQNEHISPSVLSSSPFIQYVDRNLIPEELRLSGKYAKQKEDMEKCTGSDEVWNEVEKYYTDPRFSPLVRNDMQGLPSAMILTCEFDCLRDDGILYARRLADAGVSTVWKNYENAFHGIMWFATSGRFEVGRQMFEDMIAFIQQNI